MFEAFVEGNPEPQGSLRAFPVNGRCIVTSDNPGLQSWRALVTQAVQNEMDRRRTSEFVQDLAYKDAAIEVRLRFYLPRPKSVRRKLPTVRPDIDKLARAVLDGVSDAGLWTDDANVVELSVSKKYVDGPLREGVEIVVMPV